MVAQAALESGWGKDEIRHADNRPSFNLFGIKAGESWKGAVVETLTRDFDLYMHFYLFIYNLIIYVLCDKLIMFSKLNNFYWFIRYTRNPSVKRKYYRYIQAEKKRLIDSGVDGECLRLLCRSLSKSRYAHAEKNYQRYKENCSVCR